MNQLNIAPERYREVQVDTANTLDLVRMAYDGIVESLNQAIGALEATPQSIDLFNEKLNKAQEIVLALDDGLDESQGELSTLLANFYDFVRKKMIDSNLNKSIDSVKEILELVEQVRSFWLAAGEDQIEEEGNAVGDNQSVDVTR